MLGAETQLGRIEQTIDDIIAATQAVIYELRIALLVDQEQRRRLADRKSRRKLDERLPAIIERPDRSP